MKLYRNVNNICEVIIMQNIKDRNYNSKGQVSNYIEDRKYYNHQTIHNNGVGFYSNIHTNIFKNY